MSEPPPHQRAAVFAIDTRSATGEPDLSAGAGVRLASSAQQVFVDVEGHTLSQPDLVLPVFDMSRQSGYQPVDTGAVQPVFAAERPSGVAATLDEAARRLPASTTSAPVCAARFAAMRTDVAVCTTDTRTAQALLLLGRSAASPESSPLVATVVLFTVSTAAQPSRMVA